MTETKEQMQHTPGPWTVYRMVHELTQQPMSPEQVGEYVCNSVKKSAAESGTLDFLFVSCEKPSGPADVCHVGNGPTSPANARLIAAAPELLEALKEAETYTHTTPRLRDARRAAIAKATGIRASTNLKAESGDPR